MPSPLVSIICGSRSDLEAVEKGVALLADLEVPHELRIISAHRAPALLDRYVVAAAERGVRVFICAAGLAAHLAGAVAARTAWPVIGLPMPGGVSDGLDALLSTVQMPPGVPVATVGLGNARNASLLAAQILAIADAALAARIEAFRADQTRAVEADPLNQ
ncbi:MAG: 5-(carboxyamino)imidazole ribonucleotide mutase [Chloroflexota bacterium]|nr:5-(carboxyamino)imidazole ribonucleotide mutase [Chloroflexota bacterium]